MATPAKIEKKTITKSLSPKGSVSQLQASGKKSTTTRASTAKKKTKAVSQKTMAKTTKAKVVKKTAPTKKESVVKFAVIKTGGKQYKVSVGDVLEIEKLTPEDKKKEYKEGDKIIFDKVLLLDDGKDTKVGTPYLDKVTVETEFTEEGRGKKIRILRFRAKSRHHRRLGHRQTYTKIKITAIK